MTCHDCFGNPACGLRGWRNSGEWSLRWAREVGHVLAPSCPRESPSLLLLYLRPGHLLPQHNRDVVMLRLVFWFLNGAPVPH